MKSTRPIRSALVSVYHKDRLEPLLRRLHAHGVTLLATGGTQDFIEKCGMPVVAVESLTDYPSILGGRVKTLHPKVFGGILGRRDNNEDLVELEAYSIPPIDLVIVDLYPFEETVASGADEAAIIEKIDIGGISLIRAAAKNHKDVLIIPSREHYDWLSALLDQKGAVTDSADRRLMAVHAFNVSSAYDAAIFRYFNKDESVPAYKADYQSRTQLRYGENPHQKGAFYGDLSKALTQLHGKEISYNNLLDIDAAVQLISEFSDTSFAVIKHNNACGLAVRSNLTEAWKAALAGDPVSAFGGILVTNRTIDKTTALLMNDLFFEVCIAPGYDAEALEVLKSKKNRIILINNNIEPPSIQVRTLLNGIVVQDRDSHSERPEDMKVVTRKSPTASEFMDLTFAVRLVKHTKSNAIVLAKDQQLLASGTGQTSRVDALQQAIAKAKHFGFDLKGAVMASDAFFPFPDCVEIAHAAGISAVVQPGGSIKDQDSIDAADRLGVSMVTTGYRHFKH
ncbi:MAG: bifunctional phosphoribosylaminoimidazolecarboxamide formyltransferase/IMP cyclohydrolase [Bacteroidota bacterium]